ncbi:MAG: protein kinase [Myxococcales bacterium]|nr:protein kinase [Myxococcales bacterium]
MPSSDDALVGRIVAGKFCLRQCIGVGAAGTVYRADQTSLGRTVAVKILRPEMACEPRFVRRFHDEARAASRLNHPNVVSVIDFGQTDDGLLYLVMEFLLGLTLTEVLRTEQLTSDRIADIVGQILSALEEAHERGVVHADLKADNIMVEYRRGGWDLIKVVDFGIARLTGNAEDPGDANDGSICGTPEYMAPEVIRGQEPTLAADIYAVGIILYELLVGFTPFSGSPTLEMLQRHLREEPLPPNQHPDALAVPAALEEITLRALAKDPRDRFESAADFALALKSLASEGLVAPGKELPCAECGDYTPVSFKFCQNCGAAKALKRKEFELSLEDTGHEEIWSDQSATADASAGDLQGMLRPHDTPDIIEKPLRQEDTFGELFPLPIIGHQRELDEVVEFLCSDDFGVMYLREEPGCGCSRLMREAFEIASRDGSLIFLASPDPTCQQTPFYPIRAIVTATLDLPPLCSYEDIGEALEDIGLSRRDLPGIGELFQHEGGGLSKLEAPIRRRELFASTMRVLRAAGRQLSAVLAFEDYHLFDKPSRKLLQQLAASNQRSPGLKILVASDHTVSLDWEGLRPVDLMPVGDEDMRGVVTHCTTRGQPDLVTLEELRTLTRGNPDHIHELLRYVVEGGDMRSAPESLADLLAARNSFLPSAAQRLLQVAAVFGYMVSAEDLVDTLASSMGRVELNAALHLLKDRDILVAQDKMLSFRDCMFREVVYADTPRDVKRTLHQAAGDVLIASVSDPSILGYHAEQADDMGRAGRLLARAGDNAVRQLDDAGAAALFNRALNATRTHLLSEQDANTRLQLVTISIRLADALRVGGEVGLARRILNEATENCEDAPALRAQLLRASAQLRATEGDIDGSIKLCREVIAIAIPMLAIDILTDAYLDLATMCLRAGNVEEAIRELEEGIDLVTMGEGPKVRRAPAKFWRLLLLLAQLYGAEGDPARAIEIGKHAARLAHASNSAVGTARSYATLAGLHEETGQLDKAQGFRRRAIDDMRELGDRRTTAELLLAESRPTQTVRRITPASVREARVLAEEVGWDEGVRQASGRASK